MENTHKEISITSEDAKEGKNTGICWDEKTKKKKKDKK